MANRKRFRVSGKNLAEKIEELFRRRDVRRICLMDEERSLLEVPVNVGDPVAPAAVLKAPVLAAIKAFSTLVNECTVEVELDEAEGERH